MNKWIELLYPVALVTVSGGLGYSINEYYHQREHEAAVSRCYSTRSVDAYVSKLGTDEFVCFKEDNRKKITKSLIVMPDRLLE